MSQISWHDVINAGVNHIWNTDYTYTNFEGEIESITQTKNSVVIKCKWIMALKPSRYDADGDPDFDGAEWKLWSKDSLSFSLDDEPIKTPDGSIVIRCSLERYFTETRLSKRSWFVSRSR